MAATLTSLNIALERVWTQKTLEDQLYSLTPFLDKLKKKSRYTVGETARVPLHVGRNGGYTALPDAGETSSFRRQSSTTRTTTTRSPFRARPSTAPMGSQTPSLTRPIWKSRARLPT
jgi:hypothetical protein